MIIDRQKTKHILSHKLLFFFHIITLFRFLHCCYTISTRTKLSALFFIQSFLTNEKENFLSFSLSFVLELEEEKTFSLSLILELEENRTFSLSLSRSGTGRRENLILVHLCLKT